MSNLYKIGTSNIIYDIELLFSQNVKKFLCCEKRPWHETELELKWNKKKLLVDTFSFSLSICQMHFFGFLILLKFQSHNFVDVILYAPKRKFVIFFWISSMKNRRIFGKIIHVWYSRGNSLFIILCNRKKSEKNWKNDYFHLWNTGQNIFWYFHFPLGKWWKKDFIFFKKLYMPLW